MQQDFTQGRGLDRQLVRVQWIAGGVGLLAGALCVLGAGAEPARFFPAYLAAFLFWIGLSLGCMAFLMIHSVTSGRWGIPIQRFLAAGTRTLPLMALLFLPLAAGLSTLYPWTRTDISRETLLPTQALYLNLPFFAGRALLYFTVWLALAYSLTHTLYRHDQSGDARLLARAKRIGIVGLIAYFLTATFAAFDWSMSLEPDWFSSIYGWLTISRQAVGALALVLVALGLVGRHRPPARVISPRLTQELGMLLLAALLLWAYLEFIQYLVIWYGDLPAEVIWYVRRTTGGWQWVAWGLIVLAFAVPLFLLLFPGLKQRPLILTGVAALILLLQPVEQIWLVLPVFQPQPALHWLDVVPWVALGGLWLALFVWSLRRHPLLPWRHPKLAETLEPEEREAYEAARSAF